MEGERFAVIYTANVNDDSILVALPWLFRSSQ